jgi:hypothetical protein
MLLAEFGADAVSVPKGPKVLPASIPEGMLAFVKSFLSVISSEDDTNTLMTKGTTMSAIKHNTIKVRGYKVPDYDVQAAVGYWVERGDLVAVGNTVARRFGLPRK